MPKNSKTPEGFENEDDLTRKGKMELERQTENQDFRQNLQPYKQRAEDEPPFFNQGGNFVNQSMMQLHGESEQELKRKARLGERYLNRDYSLFREGKSLGTNNEEYEKCKGNEEYVKKSQNDNQESYSFGDSSEFSVNIRNSQNGRMTRSHSALNLKC